MQVFPAIHVPVGPTERTAYVSAFRYGCGAGSNPAGDFYPIHTNILFLLSFLKSPTMPATFLFENYKKFFTLAYPSGADDTAARAQDMLYKYYIQNKE